jgi:outer membrane protein assembly factor BamB
LINEDGWFIDDVEVTADVPTPCEPTPSDVEYLTARSTSGQVKLEWVNPSGVFGSTRICRDETSYPTDPEACSTVVADEDGAAGDYDTYSDGGVDNGTKYYYTAFVNNGSGVYSGGRTVSARPFDTSGSVKWAYTTGAAALAPSGIIPGDAYYTVSNDRVLHAGAAGPSGGNWPPGWKPAGMNAPAQGRPTVIDFGAPTVPDGSGASIVAFVGSQDGRVYAFDADTGAELWASEMLGDAIQASPGGVFQIYGAAFDLVLVGTRSSTGASKFYGLDLLDGSEAWSFDNGGASDPTKAIGIISSQAWVDQDTSRVYFTSRAKAGGSDQTVWCIDFTEDSANFRWSAAAGNIDAAPTLWNNVLYVGNTDGTIYAFNADLLGTGKLPGWEHTTSDGAVKGNVWANTQAGGDVLYFSTNDTVHAVTDGGDEFPGWTPPSVPGASPVFVFGDDLFVGTSAGNGSLLKINKFTSVELGSVGLGDPTVPKSVGSGTYDYLNDMIVVGCGTGEVFGVVADF